MIEEFIIFAQFQFKTKNKKFNLLHTMDFQWEQCKKILKFQPMKLSSQLRNKTKVKRVEKRNDYFNKVFIICPFLYSIVFYWNLNRHIKFQSKNILILKFKYKISAKSINFIYSHYICQKEIWKPFRKDNCMQKTLLLLKNPIFYKI